MTELLSLWLPIVVSAALVFVASSIIWMVLPIHRHDYRGLPDETPVVDALKRQSAAPGVYMFPWADCHGGKMTKEAQAEHHARWAAGPSGTLIVAPPGFSMGKTLAIWITYLVVASTLVGYLTAAALEPGAHYLTVFRIAGTAAFLLYAGGSVPKCVWEFRPWSQLPAMLFDGVVYALLTAGAFGWLWPTGV